MSYRYILRYYIDPDFNEDVRIDEIIDFCLKSKIEEIMFFHNPEELFAGYPSEESNEKWFKLAKKLKEKLNANNIDMSINPWTTLIHLSRGRYASDEITGQKLVGENREISPITSCPFSKEWQENVSTFFAKMAKELNPTAIWIEDDWRLHNHEPSMGFGGCFCPIHMKKFSELIGREVSIEELKSEILSKNNLDWRGKWFSISQDSLIEPALYFEKKIHQANPDVKLGLMSSIVDVHSIENRDWQKLRKAFMPEGKMPLRPHVPPYTETYALTCYPTNPRATVSLYSKDEIEVYPELENSPRCGVYSKSATFAAFEIFESIVYGAKGITINHFDMMGNGMALDYDFGKKLATIKPQLNALVEFEAYEENALGVDVLYSTDTAKKFQCDANSDSFLSLINKSFSWSSTFGILGIAHTMTYKFNPNKLTAISDQTLMAFSDEEILEMLKGKLLLDGKSTEIMIQRGFGEYIGINNCETVTLQESAFSYEDITSTKERMSAQRCSPYIYKFSDCIGENLSMMKKYDHTDISPALHSYKNSLGGTVIASCYPMELGQFYMGYFNNFRRNFLQNVIKDNLQTEKFACATARPMHLFFNQNDKKEYLLSIVNATMDTIDNVNFELINVEFSEAYMLDKSGSWQKIELKATNDNCYKVDTVLTALEGLFIKLR